MRVMVATALMTQAGAAFAARPNEARYPNLVKSWEALQNARNRLQKAEQAHLRRGALGGHAMKAVEAVDAAQAEIDMAVQFADTHRRPGPPGVVTPKPPLAAHPDDAKYPNLGDARMQIEWAIRHIEDAMQYHASTGTLGGHGEKAVEDGRQALREIGEAQRWADTHR